jgi:hypothetical protein
MIDEPSSYLDVRQRLKAAEASHRLGNGSTALAGRLLLLMRAAFPTRTSVLARTFALATHAHTFTEV